MANVKVKKESTSNGGGMITGIIIVACILVGVLIWKLIMGMLLQTLKEVIQKQVTQSIL